MRQSKPVFFVSANGRNPFTSMSPTTHAETIRASATLSFSVIAKVIIAINIPHLIASRLNAWRHLNLGVAVCSSAATLTGERSSLRRFNRKIRMASPKTRMMKPVKGTDHENVFVITQPGGVLGQSAHGGLIQALRRSIVDVLHTGGPFQLGGF